MASDDRLREHPKDRLATAIQQIDLAAAAAHLRAEGHASVSGHRQQALVRRGPFSLILFAFEKDGFLKEHQADGEVIIQVIRGRLSVAVSGQDIVLGVGTLVALAPGERHSVRALEECDMLLSLTRQPAGGDD